MLKIENLKKNYGDFRLDCSLEVKPGCITGLVGPNGSGKSTTFKAVLGLIRFDEGDIEILGRDVRHLSSSDREEIGVVFSDSGFSNYLNIRDIISVMKGFYRNFDRNTFVARCHRYHLPMDKKLKDFSTGMKALLKVLLALSHHARFVLLDEPTAGLDVIARDSVLVLIRSYMEEDENRSVLISSHIAGDLEKLCDDLYMLHDGRIVFHEDTDVLLSEYGLIKASLQQYDLLDKKYILRMKKESFGVSCLTSEKRFYEENYPGLVIEKGSIDEMIMMMVSGEDAAQQKGGKKK